MRTNLYQFVNSNVLRTHQCLQKHILKNIKNSEIGYFFILDVEYPKHSHPLQKHLQFLSEKIKTATATKKTKKIVCNVYDKGNYPAHIRLMQQALYHGFRLKKTTQGYQN